MSLATSITTNTKRPFFTEEHVLFQKSLRKFLQKEAEPYFEDWEKEGRVPREFWKKVGNKLIFMPVV